MKTRLFFRKEQPVDRARTASRAIRAGGATVSLLAAGVAIALIGQGDLQRVDAVYDRSPLTRDL